MLTWRHFLHLFRSHFCFDPVISGFPKPHFVIHVATPVTPFTSNCCTWLYRAAERLWIPFAPFALAIYFSTLNHPISLWKKKLRSTRRIYESTQSDTKLQNHLNPLVARGSCFQLIMCQSHCRAVAQNSRICYHLRLKLKDYSDRVMHSLPFSALWPLVFIKLLHALEALAPWEISRMMLEHIEIK